MVTVLAWTAEEPGFESWFEHLSICSELCYRISFLCRHGSGTIEPICAESAIKHQPILMTMMMIIIMWIYSKATESAHSIRFIHADQWR